MPRAQRRLLLPILAASLSCGTSTSAPSDVVKSCTVTTVNVFVNAGDTLRLTFTVPPNSTADLLSYDLEGLPNPLVPGPGFSCQLFDGDRLLGTDGKCGGGWQSSTASVRLPSVPQIDFSTIAAGTVAGRIDLNITGGSWAFAGKGTVSLGRTTMTDSGPSVTYLGAGTAAPLQVIGPSCK
jgi:hypothetical protein